MANHWLIVLNPNSDRGQAAKAAPLIRRILESYGISFELLITPSTSTAQERIEALSGKATMVVAAGGDGTVHNAVNALMKVKQRNNGHTASLGVIPIGTGNDFAKMLGMSGEIEALLKLLISAEHKAVDIAEITNDDSGSRFFSNNVGVGFDAFVNYQSTQIKYLRGIAIYYTAVLSSILKYVHSEMEIHIGDEKIRRKILMVTTGNGACSGGGFYVTPDAEVNDGLLDFCIIDSRPKWQMLMDLPKVTKGEHASVGGVEMKRGTALRIKSETPLPIHADGEVVSLNARDIELKIHPAALTAAYAKK